MSSGEASDEALMLRYQRGDRSAFAMLVRRHQVAVYTFVLRQLGSALPADEIAQQVFLGVVREGARFNYETPFSTRLFSIAYRLIQAERERRPARRALKDETKAPDSGRSDSGRSDNGRSDNGRSDNGRSNSGPSNSGLSKGSAASETLEDSISRAVDDLPDEQKDVFLLREVADLPFAEIASITRQTENAVKVQMQHALQRLRVALQDFDEYRRALR
jgi:RNA polymerase sigma-70 factor, ECF subfamily